MLSEENVSDSALIMVVEDDRIISVLLKHILNRRGFNARLVADGRAALKMLDEIAPPRLVLMDVMLPFVNGFELLERIRSKPGWRNVPVIMLTSKSQERDISRALEAGANDYIVKPFEPEELMARVRRFVTEK